MIKAVNDTIGVLDYDNRDWEVQESLEVVRLYHRIDTVLVLDSEERAKSRNVRGHRIR